MDLQRDEVIALLEADHNRDPRHAPYGVFVHDPVGVGMFGWYVTEDDRARSLLDHNHVLSDDPETWAPVRAQLATLIADLSPLRPDTASKADKLTADHFRVGWWGTFDDLCTGEHEIAVELRERVRGTDDEAADPLLDGEVDAFIEVIGEYGV